MLDTGMRGQNKESRWGTGKRRRGNRDVAEPTALLLVGERRVGKSDTRAEKRQRGSGKTAWQTTTTTCTYITGRGLPAAYHGRNTSQQQQIREREAINSCKQRGGQGWAAAIKEAKQTMKQEQQQ